MRGPIAACLDCNAMCVGAGEAFRAPLRHRIAHTCTCLLCAPTDVQSAQAGITEHLVFKHLHEDAEHLYNTTMSLHAVVTQLTDRGRRLPRKVGGAPGRGLVRVVVSRSGAASLRKPRGMAAVAAGLHVRTPGALPCSSSQLSAVLVGGFRVLTVAQLCFSCLSQLRC
jgi:hypothetical protein